jgi:hypothetical protein
MPSSGRSSGSAGKAFKQQRLLAAERSPFGQPLYRQDAICAWKAVIARQPINARAVAAAG